MHRRRRPASILAVTLLAGVGLTAAAQERMPPLPPDALTEQQAQALADFVAAGGEPGGPWNAFLRSPGLMTHARGLGDHFALESVLPGWLREFVALLTAREWTQNYEWNAHYPLAIDEGFSAEMARAVAEGRRPEAMVEEEAILYDFCVELQRNRSVSDATYERAVSRFGEQGVVEIVSLMGYYTMISMLSNTTRVPLPPGATPALSPFPQ